jgi:hypothetical protein
MFANFSCDKKRNSPLISSLDKDPDTDGASPASSMEPLNETANSSPGPSEVFGSGAADLRCRFDAPDTTSPSKVRPGKPAFFEKYSADVLHYTIAMTTDTVINDVGSGRETLF